MFGQRKQASESVTVPFKELIGVNLPSGTAANTVVSNILMGMTAFQGTRLGVMANTWEKFKFLKLRVRVISSAPSSTAGNMILAWDADPTDATPPNTAGGMQTLTTMAAAEVFPIWSGIEFDVPITTDRETGFFTNFNNSTSTPADPRLYQQGQLYLATMAPPASNIQLSMEISGIVRFWTRALEAPASPTEVINSAPATLSNSATFNNGNVLSPLLNGTASQSTLANGLNLTATVLNAFGNSAFPTTTGFVLGPGNYEILFSGKGMQTSTSPFSLSASLPSLPGARQPAAIVVDSTMSQLNGNASVTNNCFGRWFANVVDPVGAFFFLNLASVTSPLTYAGAMSAQVRKITSAA